MYQNKKQKDSAVQKDDLDLAHFMQNEKMLKVAVFYS